MSPAHSRFADWSNRSLRHFTRHLFKCTFTALSVYHHQYDHDTPGSVWLESGPSHCGKFCTLCVACALDIDILSQGALAVAAFGLFLRPVLYSLPIHTDLGVSIAGFGEGVVQHFPRECSPDTVSCSMRSHNVGVAKIQVSK